MVKFPLHNLNLSELISSPQRDAPVYDLYAVSNHMGGLGGGHYTAYAKNRKDANWYLFNDRSVSKVDEGSVPTSNAYCLFYNKMVIAHEGYRRQSASMPHLWPHMVRSFAIGSVDRRKSLLFVLLNVKDFTTHFDCLLLVLLLVSFV